MRNTQAIQQERQQHAFYVGAMTIDYRAAMRIADEKARTLNDEFEAAQKYEAAAAEAQKPTAMLARIEKLEAAHVAAKESSNDQG